MNKIPYKSTDRYQPKRVKDVKRILCDFLSRPERERDIFTQTTWCDSCSFGNLGMFEPVEYMLGEKKYVEGKCTRCGSIVVSEIVKSEVDGVEEDIIWPIHHASKTALTYLPRKSYGTFVFGGPSKFSYSPLRTPRKISKAAQIIFWIICAILVLIGIIIFLNNLKYGH